MSDVVRDVIEKTKVEDTNETEDLLNESLCNFGLQLLQDIASDGQTVVLSPTAIVLSLGLLYCGTDGETKLQLKRAISSLAITDEELLKKLKQINISVNTTSKEFVLRISKWLFSSLKYETNQVYEETIARVFKSNVLAVDFASNAEQLRQEINSLIKEETNKKIRDVISVGVLTTKTKLLSVNAAYFQHFWLNCVITKDHKFYRTKSTTITVDMVTITGDELKYTKNNKCQILGIPYRRSDIATFFILPNEEFEFNEFCTHLSGQGLIRLLDSAYTSSVHVSYSNGEHRNSTFTQTYSIQILSLIIIFHETCIPICECLFFRLKYHCLTCNRDST